MNVKQTICYTTASTRCSNYIDSILELSCKPVTSVGLSYAQLSSVGRSYTSVSCKPVTSAGLSCKPVSSVGLSCKPVTSAGLSCKPVSMTDYVEMVRASCFEFMPRNLTIMTINKKMQLS